MLLLNQNIPTAVQWERRPTTPQPYLLLEFNAAYTTAQTRVVVPVETCATGLRFTLPPGVLPPGSYALNAWLQASPTNLDPALAAAAFLTALETHVRTHPA